VRLIRHYRTILRLEPLSEVEVNSGERGSCGVYWYKFMWQGKLIRESTKQRNDKFARQTEAAHRTSLAKGEVGIREKKLVPTLAEFAQSRFMPWAEITFASKLKTWMWYRNGVRRLLGYAPIAELKLDELNSEQIAAYWATAKLRDSKSRASIANFRCYEGCFIWPSIGASLKRSRDSRCYPVNGIVNLYCLDRKKLNTSPPRPNP
jgi:hypothetical protein